MPSEISINPPGFGAKDIETSRVPRSKSLTATVAERLRERIIDGSIPLGSMLSEKVLAESWGVSKTPVREALVQLQAIGLVTILPQRGGLVFRPDAERVRELCEVRLELESCGMRYSMERQRSEFAKRLTSIVSSMRDSFKDGDFIRYQRLDNLFHAAFFEHCGNSLLLDAYETFYPRICALRTHLATPNVARLNRSMDEHALMMDLVKSGDQHQSLDVLRQHITQTQFHSRQSMAESAPGP